MHIHPAWKTVKAHIVTIVTWANLTQAAWVKGFGAATGKRTALAIEQMADRHADRGQDTFRGHLP
jgi:hypothetical protein